MTTVAIFSFPVRIMKLGKFPGLNFFFVSYIFLVLVDNMHHFIREEMNSTCPMAFFIVQSYINMHFLNYTQGTA